MYLDVEVVRYELGELGKLVAPDSPARAPERSDSDHALQIAPSCESASPTPARDGHILAVVRIAPFWLLAAAAGNRVSHDVAGANWGGPGRHGGHDGLLRTDRTAPCGAARAASASGRDATTGSAHDPAADAGPTNRPFGPRAARQELERADDGNTVVLAS